MDSPVLNSGVTTSGHGSAGVWRWGEGDLCGGETGSSRPQKLAGVGAHWNSGSWSVGVGLGHLSLFAY